MTLGRQYTMLFWSQLDADILGPNMFGSGSLDSYLPNARTDNAIAYRGKLGGVELGSQRLPRLAQPVGRRLLQGGRDLVDGGRAAEPCSHFAIQLGQPFAQLRVPGDNLQMTIKLHLAGHAGLPQEAATATGPLFALQA